MLKAKCGACDREIRVTMSHHPGFASGRTYRFATHFFKQDGKRRMCLLSGKRVTRLGGAGMEAK